MQHTKTIFHTSRLDIQNVLQSAFYKLVLASLILICLTPGSTLAWSGKVVKIADGDTITVLKGFQPIKIRFYGIDTPEKKQAFGKAAKRHLTSFVANRTVEIKPVTQDRYGRTVALVFAGGININQKMVQDGYAWVYRRYCKKAFCSQWMRLEQRAREQRIGLWQDPHPVPPWKWRHNRKNRKGFAGVLTRMRKSNGQFGPCGTKRYCKQMRSCEEAYYFLRQCGLSRLDRDGDGVPCEALCKK